MSFSGKLPSIFQIKAKLQAMSKLNLWFGLFSSVLVSIVSSSVLHQRAQGINTTNLWDLAPAGNITILRVSSSLDLSWPEISPTGLASSSDTLPTPATSLGADSNAPELELTTPRVKCDKSAYGRGLNIPSCQEAWDLLPKSTNRQTFGQRKEGDFNVPLPYRVLSCKEDPNL